MTAASNEILMLNFLVEDKTPKAVSADQILPRAMRALRTQLGMDTAFISEFRDGRRVFRYVDVSAAGHSIQPGGSDALEGSYCQRVLDRQLPELIPNASALASPSHSPCALSQVASHLCVPIRLYDGRVYGTLVCLSGMPNDSLNERDLSMMRVFAEMAAEHIEADIQANRQQLEFSERIQAVLKGDDISLVYQPIFDLRHARVLGFESLARFTTAPMRSPAAWFSDAAAVGLDIALELKVIEKALGSFTNLPAGVYIVFNVSPNIVINGRLEWAFNGMPLDRIVLEINEHVSIREYDEILKTLKPMREQGLRISVDDTGAGLASFRHILSLKPDIIKMHMSLTRGIDSDPARRALAAALIQFARENQSDVIAEGVETAAELKALRLLGVTRAQGYFLGKPSPLAAAVLLCRRNAAAEEKRAALDS